VAVGVVTATLTTHHPVREGPQPSQELLVVVAVAQLQARMVPGGFLRAALSTCAGGMDRQVAAEQALMVARLRVQGLLVQVLVGAGRAWDLVVVVAGALSCT